MSPDKTSGPSVQRKDFIFAAAIVASLLAALAWDKWLAPRFLS